MAVEKISPEINVDLVAERYMEIGEALGKMFLAMGERSEVEGWRFDGVGSCWTTRSVANAGLVGPAKDKIWSLRDENLKKQRREFGSIDFKEDCCPFHRRDFGCVLGTLKSPLCMSYIDSPEELKRRFNIDGNQLSLTISRILAVTLAQNAAFAEDPILCTVSADEYHQFALDSISEVTAYIEKFSVLGDEDRTQLNLYRKGHRIS